ncbi:MAG: macro domain-containing protein [Thermoanaerobaculia bacterium]|nr:macro domain-containing protein [Thermoanaerobaculia bacterium]
MSIRIEIIEGDITELEVDAIVNAANSALQHGGGVAGAIVSRGGRSIQDESDEIGRVPTGSAAVTGAGSLPAKWVIHAVGPRMGEGDEDEKLESATRSALEKADEIGAKSIGFPAISTGIFGYPIERCAEVMLRTVDSFASETETVERVVFCLFGSEALEVFQREYDRSYG